MGFTFDAPESLEGSTYMDKPGRFHFLVTDVREGRLPKGDQGIEGFSVELEALAGSEPSQVGKKTNIVLRNGQPGHQDGGAMCRRKQAAFLIAANLLTPSGLGRSGYDLDLEKARGAQIIAELELGDEQSNGKRYLELAYANIYHVDDPRAQPVPKAEESLGSIPEAFRHVGDEAYFAPLMPKQQQASAAAASSAKGSSNGDYEGL